MLFLNIYIFLQILSIVLFLKCANSVKVSARLRQKLDTEYEKNFCCKHNLRCCKENFDSDTSEEPSKFEIKTFLHDCPNPQCVTNSSVQKIINHNINGSTTTQQKLTNCKQKLLLTIKVINEGQPSLKSQYIIIDHIIDRKTQKKINILNPYAIRIRQEPLVEQYGLNFIKSVNGEARENVVRQKRNVEEGGKGGKCMIDKTCQGQNVPYSSGFCCSCNDDDDGGGSGKVQWPHQQLPAEDRNSYKHYGFTRGTVYYHNLEKRADKSVNYYDVDDENNNLKNNFANFLRHKRNALSCDDTNLDFLHQTTHCLQFSSTWYSLYELEQPRVMHSLKMQIFQKYEDCSGNTHWLDLTQGRTIEMGNESPTSNDQDIGIVTHYHFGTENCADILDYKSNTLLIPEQIVSPEQFMLIPNKMVSHDGKQCNSVGVGYEAFYKQKKRCAQPIGSCLNNQPNHFYQEDIKAEQQGQSGQYFLKYFAMPAPENALGYSSKGEIESIKLVYTGRHTSTVTVELNADLVTLMKPNIFATITEIYTVSTTIERTQIIAKITNSGLLYGVYYVRLNGCPLQVPASLNNIASKSVLIPAQHQHIFKLDIEVELMQKEIECHLQVHNINQELVASRKVLIRTGDRCICVWYCKCTCLIRDTRLKCTQLDLDEYHLAGYQGGMPLPVKIVEPTKWDELFSMVFHMFILFLLTLLVMGLIKACLGLCFEEIGVWGLDTLLGTDQKESTCKCCNDDDDDDDGISLPAQFCLNVIFFVVYPLALINILIRKLCTTRYTNESESVCFHKHSTMEWCGDENCSRNSSSSIKKKKSSMDSKCCSLIYTSSDDKDVECICTE